MAVRIEEFRLSDLLVDRENARLGVVRENQQDAILAIAALDPEHFINLARSIVDKGLDPMAYPGVVALEGKRKEYLVLEGNRRITVLKALDNPRLIEPCLSASQKKRFFKLATQFTTPASIYCCLFASIEEADHWIHLRHTGRNGGIGLVEWGAEEKDNWNQRHGRRSHFLQISEFTQKFGELSPEALSSKIKYKHAFMRLLATIGPHVGLFKKNRLTFSEYPVNEIAPVIAHIYGQFRLGEINTNDVHGKKNRWDYYNKLPEDLLPDESSKLEEPIPLDDFTFGRVEINSSKNLKSSVSGNNGNGKKKKKKKAPRTSVIPRECPWDISRPRLNHIFVELSGMSHNSHPEAVSVLLRVFLELAMDDYIERTNILADKKRRSTNLANKLNLIAADLHSKTLISAQLKKAVYAFAKNNTYLQPSVVNFNQYVHNLYLNPNAGELEKLWDITLEPFLDKVFE